MTMCSRRRFQPCFLVDHVKKRINMVTHIFLADNVHRSESVILTNWGAVPTDDMQHLSWKKDGSDVSLEMSDFLCDRFIPRLCDESNQCVLCNDRNGSSASDIRRNKGHYVKGISSCREETTKNKCNPQVPFPPKRSGIKARYPSTYKKGSKYIRIRDVEKKSKCFDVCVGNHSDCTCSPANVENQKNYLCPRKWAFRDNYQTCKR